MQAVTIQGVGGNTEQTVRPPASLWYAVAGAWLCRWSDRTMILQYLQQLKAKHIVLASGDHLQRAPVLQMQRSVGGS